MKYRSIYILKLKNRLLVAGVIISHHADKSTGGVTLYHAMSPTENIDTDLGVLYTPETKDYRMENKSQNIRKTPK